MIESLKVAFYAIFPVIFMVGVGYLTKTTKMVSQESFKDFNKVIFQICLPITLFENIIFSNFNQLFDPVLILYSIGFLCIVIGITACILHFMDMPTRVKGVIVQAIYRSNFVILGLPILKSIYGDRIGITALLVTFTVPFMNIVAIVVLQQYSMHKKSILNGLLQTLKIPMVTGSLLGFIVLSLHLTFPKIFYDCIHLVSSLTTPLSLFVLGGCFKVESLKKHKKYLFCIGLCRLLIVPIIGIVIAIFIGYRGVALVSMLILFGGPVAVASYPTAELMGFDGDIASQAVLLTTIFVFITLFFFLFSFSYFQIL